MQYIIAEYYAGDVSRASHLSGYKVATIENWVSGSRTPQKNTLEYFIQCAFVPEFTVISEFAEFESQKPLQTQLKAILGVHSNDPGIYAFYDSMGGLIYIGKAKKLLAEISSAIKRPIHIAFPKGVKNIPKCRTEIVKYISAYDVGGARSSDFPRHVESLILRISKPTLNKNIGSLSKAYKQPRDA
ncbi:hypothetical protein [Duganella sp. Dugasp56]|uniref:hypothetical protein n=1 Tax=Duganella sp. Dugasp56 TaxID=3243046 RepID=UPI0039AEF152